MKKSVFGGLIVILALLGIAYLASSWYVGKIGQEKLNEFVADVNQQIKNQTNTEQSIKIIDYKRGLLTSLVTYQIDYLVDGETKSILLVDKLAHGPLPLNLVIKGEFTPLIAYSHIKPMHKGPMLAWFDLMQNDAMPWELKNRYFFDGSVLSDLRLNAINNPEKQITFSGGNFLGSYKQDNISITGLLPELKAVEPDSKIAFSLQDMDFDLNTNISSIGSNTSQNIKLAKLQVDLDKETSIRLIKPDFKISTVLENELTNSLIDYDFGQVSLSNIDSPDMDFGKLNASIAVKNVNAIVLQKILGIFSSMDTENIEFEIDKKLDKQLQQLFQQLFNSYPEVDLQSLRWQIDDKVSNIKSNLLFGPVESDDFNNLNELIEQALDSYKLSFELRKQMIFDVLRTQFDDRTIQLFSMLFDHYAANLARSGLINIDNNTLSGDLIYTNQNLTVNGKQMSLFDLNDLFGSIISP